MSHIKNVNIKLADSVSTDAFGRMRVSNPVTVFESKLIRDKQPLFWDELLESGAGITSTHSSDTASVVLSSTASTAGTFTRQTFMRFNYQPGKSQAIFLTGVLQKSGGGTGVTRRIGYFDDDNGLFFEDYEGTVRVVKRSYTSGSAVDTPVAQSAWNIDKMDGTGPSGLIVDWTTAQIFSIDFQWLGVGRVRFDIVINGVAWPVHEMNHANSVTEVYMSTPNLPIRYQMITTGAASAASMSQICSTVTNEGGHKSIDVTRYASTSGTHVNANTEGTLYALIGMRLKSDHTGANVHPILTSIGEHSGAKSYEWCLILNPTVAGTFTYVDQTNSAIQIARGTDTSTLTGGTHIAGGLGASDRRGGASIEALESAVRLGVAIDGTVDELVLAVRPIGGTSNLDVDGAIEWQELL